MDFGDLVIWIILVFALLGMFVTYFFILKVLWPYFLPVFELIFEGGVPQ